MALILSKASRAVCPSNVWFGALNQLAARRDEAKENTSAMLWLALYC